MGATLAFPVSLAEKYRPQTLAGFVGLEKQKKILGKLAANPRPCALLFQGAPGTGKTSIAYAFAAEYARRFTISARKNAKWNGYKSWSAPANTCLFLVGIT
jgi:replication-associated recombination protein RarA